MTKVTIVEKCAEKKEGDKREGVYIYLLLALFPLVLPFFSETVGKSKQRHTTREKARYQAGRDS